jgi:hypothetical protein
VRGINYRTDHNTGCNVYFPKCITIAVLLAILQSGDLRGQQFPRASGVSPGSGSFGVGFVVGEPTGFSAKYWTQSSRAWDFALGASFYSDFRFHGTYLFHIDAFNHQRVPLHYGIGLSVVGKGERAVFLGGNRVKHRTEAGIGPRASLGISFLPRSAPFDMFIELGATLFVIRPVGVEADLLLGGRYYF